MDDTNSVVARKFYRLIMAKSKEQRLLMGFSMFDTAKEIMKAAIMEQHPKISAKEMKKEIFLRFYGMEFSKSEREAILESLMRE